MKFSRGSHGSHGRHGNRATAKYLRRDTARVDERVESDGTAYTILPSRSWSVISSCAEWRSARANFCRRSSSVDRFARSTRHGRLDDDRASWRRVIELIRARDRSVDPPTRSPVRITPSAAADNNYSSNVLCGLCQREHAPLGQTRHTWGRRKNSQRVKAVRKTVRDPGAKDPPAIDAMDKTVWSVGRSDLRVRLNDSCTKRIVSVSHFLSKARGGN